MASPNAFDGHPTALNGTPFTNGFRGIGRTGGRMPAGGRGKGRNKVFVDPDEEQEGQSKIPAKWGNSGLL